MPKVEILLASKDRELSLNLIDMLANNGYPVSGPFETLEKVQKLVSENTPALIFIDLGFESNFDELKATVKILENHKIPLVFLTDSLSFPPIDKIRDFPHYVFIDKQVSCLTLISTIESALYRHTLEIRLEETNTKLKKNEEIFHSIFDNANESILVVQDSKVKLYNKKLAKLLQGYSDYGIFNSIFTEFIHPDDREMVYENYKRRIKGETLPSRYSFRVKTGGGIAKWLEISAVFIEWEGAPATLNFLTDITEQKIAENALYQKEFDLDIALKSVNMGVWYSDLCEHKLYFDDQVCKLLSIDSKNFTGTSEEFYRTVHPDDREKIKNALQHTICYDTLYDPEYRIVLPDGSIRYVAARGKLFRDDKRNPLRIHGIIWDITVSKLAENALKESEEQLGTIFNAIGDAVFISAINGSLLRVNNTSCESLGYSMEELLKKCQYDITPENPAIIEARTNEILKNGPIEYETIQIGKNGSSFPVEIRSSLINFGGYPAILSIARNITKRKQAEKELNESQEKFRLIAEKIDDVFWIADIELNNTIYVSPGFEKIWGKTLESAYKNPKTFLDSIHNEDLPGVLKTLEIEKTGQPFSHEYRIVRPDGEIRWIWETGFPIDDGDKKIKKYVGVSKDITERKKTEEALKLSQERYREVFNNTSDGIFILDVETEDRFKISEFNHSEEKMVGVSNIDVAGKYIDEIFSKDVADSIIRKYRECVNKGVPIDYEEALSLSTGINYYHTSLIPIRDKTGNIYRIFGISRDITENKKALESLRESELKQCAMIANISDVITILDNDCTIKYNSPNIEKLFGWSPEELIGSKGWALVHPGDLERIKNEFFNLLQEHKAVETVEFNFRRKDGSYRNVELQSVNLINNPLINGILVNYHDITERKAAENALRQNENKLKGIFMTAPVGIGVSVNRIFRETNDELSRITGYSQEELYGMNAGKLFFTEEEGESFSSEIRLQMAKTGLGHLETRWRRKTGEVIDSVIAAVPLDSADYNKGLLFTVTDITERKRIEHKVRESREHLRLIADNVPGLILHVGNDLKYIFANKYLSKLFNFSPKQVIGKHVRDVVGEEAYKLIKPHIEKVLSGTKTDFYRELTDISGETRTIHAVLEPEYGEDGQVKAFFALTQDITDKIKSEEKFAVLYERLDLAKRSANIGIWDWDIRENKLVWDDRMYELYGVERDDFEYTYESWLKSIHPEDRERCDSLSLDARAGKCEYDSVFRIIHPSGDIRIIKTYGRIIRDSKGNPLRMTGINLDITEQKRAEESLRESEERFQQIFDNMADGVAVYQAIDEGSDFLILDINRKGQQLSQISHDDAVGKRVTEVFPQIYKMGLLDKFKKVWLTGKPEHHPLTAYEDNRITQWVENYVFRLPSGLIVALYSDTSAQRRVENALRESEEIFRQFMENSPIYVFFKDSNIRSIKLSRNYEQMLGKPIEELIGKTMDEIFPAALAKNMIEDDRRILREGKLISVDEEMNGRFYTTIKFPILIEEKPMYLAGYTIDMTERKKAELALAESEELYRRLSEDMPLYVYIFQPDGTLQFVNESLASMTGLSVKDLKGRNIFEVLSPENFESVKKRLYSLTPDNPIQTREQEYLSREGRRHWHQWTIRAFFNDNGQITRFQGVGQDITVRKLAEEALRESKEHLRLITDNLPVFIAHINKNLRFTFVNRECGNFLNLPVKRIIGKHIKKIFRKETYEKSSIYIKQVLSGKTAEYEDEISGPDNKILTYHFTFIPDFNNEGGIKGYFVMIQDVTEKKNAEKERIELERRLLHAQKLESLGILAGGIAHDFNNLLMAILGNLDLALLEIPPLSPAKYSIEDAIRASKRAADLTTQMLAYSGKGRFIVSEIDLTMLVNENAHIFKTAISKSATLNLRLETGLPPIKGDVGQIQQVVMNMITNASDAITDKPGIIAITTGIMTCSEKCLSMSRLEEKPKAGEFVYLEVSDTGIGMDENTKQKMFDPFFTTKFTGRGLGMSAVLGILRGHDGAILVDSEQNKGTIIRVLFPASETPDKAGEPDLYRDLRISQGKSEKQSTLILIVDDEEGVRLFSEKALQFFGYSCLTAADGIEAIEVFRQKQAEIDLVLLDLTMPRMDGAATITELLKLKPDLKVILSSGYNEIEATRRFKDTELAGFIQKPYDLKKLREILTKVLGE